MTILNLTQHPATPDQLAAWRNPVIRRAMIGGAPYLMAPLEIALRDVGIRPLYAFSVRASVEKTRPDGSVEKINVFKHGGFVGLDADEPSPDGGRDDGA